MGYYAFLKRAVQTDFYGTLPARTPDDERPGNLCIMVPTSRAGRQSSYRVNVIDEKGTVSFLAPPHGLKVLAAAITQGAATSADLLALSHTFDAQWATDIRRQIIRFDEHNIDVVADRFKDAIAGADGPAHPAFRVIDPETRRRSLVPGRLGLVVFNLKERRIIQIQNNYSNLERKDRGRVRVGGEPTDTVFQYELPLEWSLVP